MGWLIERDETGEAVRMWWTGPEKPTQKDKDEVLNRCSKCGYADGWHTAACRQPVSADAGEKVTK